MSETFRLFMVSFIFLAFFVCLFLVWFFSHRAKHREKMLILEKDLDPKSIFKENKHFHFPWAKIGIVIIGLSIGLLIISILVSLKVLENGGNAFPLGILGICGGVSMVIARRIDNRHPKD